MLFWFESLIRRYCILVYVFLLIQICFFFLLFVLSGLSSNLITLSELPLSVSISGALMLIGAFAVLIFGGYTLVLLALIIISDPKAFFFEKTEKIKQKLKPTGGKA